MKYVGKLDKEKIKFLGNIITTEEVIITEERIAHVKARHQNDYEKYSKYLLDIIKYPDYICIDKKNENTIFAMKCIENNNIQVVIKLQTDKKEIHRKKFYTNILEYKRKKL